MTHGVPVIVDAASEYDLKGFLAAGADIVVYSAHKFLGGPTAGIVAGRKDLVRAAYLQNCGIGRGMKVGKESIAGAMAALEAWAQRDHAARARRSSAIISSSGWIAWASCRVSTSRSSLTPPTTRSTGSRSGSIPADAGTTAWALAAALAAGDPPVIVRDHEVEHGRFYLDPCNLHPGEAEQVAEAMAATLEAIRGQPSPALRSCAIARTRGCWLGLIDLGCRNCVAGVARWQR